MFSYCFCWVVVVFVAAVVVVLVVFNDTSQIMCLQFYIIYCIKARAPN